MSRRRASLFVLALGALIALAAQLAGNAALEFRGHVAALEVVNKLATGCNPVGRRVTTLGSGDALLTSLSGASNAILSTKTIAYDTDGWTGSVADRGSILAFTGSSWGVGSEGANATITYGQSVQTQTITGGSASWSSPAIVHTGASLAGYNDVLVVGGRTWVTYVKDGALRVGWRASGDPNFTTAAVPGAVAAPSFAGALVPYVRTYTEASTTYTSEVAVVYPTGSDGETLRVTSVDPTGSGHLVTEGEHTFADTPSLPSAVSIDDDEVHAVVSVDGEVVALAGSWDAVDGELDFTATTLSADDVEVPSGCAGSGAATIAAVDGYLVAAWAESLADDQTALRYRVAIDGTWGPERTRPYDASNAIVNSTKPHLARGGHDGAVPFSYVGTDNAATPTYLTFLDGIDATAFDAGTAAFSPNADNWSDTLSVTLELPTAAGASWIVDMPSGTDPSGSCSASGITTTCTWDGKQAGVAVAEGTYPMTITTTGVTITRGVDVVVDVTKPTTSLSLNSVSDPGGNWTNQAAITAFIDAVDGGAVPAGVDAYSMSNDGLVWGTWVDFDCVEGVGCDSSPWTLAAGDGLKTVHRRAAG